MAWSLASQTIHPPDGGDTRNFEAYYTVLEVLDATANNIAFYGAASEKRSLSFILDETENSGTGLASLITAKNTDASVNLTSDVGSQGNYRILTLSAVRVQALNKSAAVWKCAVELIAG